MSARKNETQFASTDPDEAAGNRWTRGRVIWVAIAVVAAAGSIVFGLVAMQEADFRVAQQAFESEQYRIAKIELEHFLSTNQDHAEAQVLYARTLVNLNEDPETALRIFETFQAATPEETHAWARANFMLERWSAGVPLVAQVVKAQPDNAEALREWVAALLRMRQYEQAREPALKYMEKGDKPALAHLFLGTIEDALDNPLQAEKHFAKVLEIEPAAENLTVPPADFFANYAQILLVNGKAQEAHDQADRSVSYRRNPMAFLVLGESLQQLGDNLNSREAFIACVDVDQNNVVARSRLAEIELTENSPEKALGWLAPVLAVPRNVSSEVSYLIERCYRRLKDEENIQIWSARTKQLRISEEKLAKLQHMAIAFPTSFDALMYRVWQFASEGNWDEAQVVLGSMGQVEDRFQSAFGERLVESVDARDPNKVPSIYEYEFREEKPGPKNAKPQPKSAAGGDGNSP